MDMICVMIIGIKYELCNCKLGIMRLRVISKDLIYIGMHVLRAWNLTLSLKDKDLGYI